MPNMERPDTIMIAAESNCGVPGYDSSAGRHYLYNAHRFLEFIS